MAFSARWVLPNGLTVIYRQDNGMPLAAGTLILKTGSLYEKPAEAGLANLTTELLFQGTRRRSALQIADAIESMGASLGAQVADDYTEMGFVAPEQKIGSVLSILVDVLMHPTFPLQEIEKERKQILAGLESRKDQLFNRAFDLFNAALYGRHPYGRPSEGTAETVKRFRRPDLIAWHAMQVRPERAIFSLVASLPRSQVEKLLTREFRPWKKLSEPFAARPLPASALPRDSKHLRAHARFEQAYLMTGVTAPGALDEGYIELKLLNTIMGGGMSSRLFLKLREEMGLAYDVSSFFPTHLLSSQWVLHMGLPAEKLSTAKRVMEEMLSDLKRRGPRPDELTQAIQMVHGSYLMEHQSRRRRSWYAAWWEFLGKPYDFDRDFLRRIANVQIHELHALAKDLLSRPRITVEVLPK